MTDTKTIAFDVDEIKAGLEKAVHATIGAGVVAGRKVAEYDVKGKLEALGLKERFETVKTADYKAKADEYGTKARDEFVAAYGEWARVGAETVSELRTKVDVDDLTHKVGERVHVDQWQEQADKLRGQLEDLVTNWRTNFAPEGEVTETVEVEIDEAKDDLAEIKGVGPTYASRLAEVGILTFADLAKADAAKVAEVAKVSEKVAGSWIAAATQK
jgi:hypothetical protein